MSGDIIQHPVIVVTRIIRLYQQTQTTTCITGKSVIKRISIRVPVITYRNLQCPGTAIWDNRLPESICAANREGGRRQLTRYRKCLRPASGSYKQKNK